MPAKVLVPHSISKVVRSLKALRAKHHERHRPSGFGFVLADRIDYLPAKHWEAIANYGTFFLRREVLQVIEASGPENLTPRYAMIFAGEKPVAIMAAQLVAVTGAQFGGTGKSKARSKRADFLRKALSPTARLATARIEERLLVAGNLLSWGFHGVAFAPDVDSTTVWPAVAEALYRIRRSERLAGQTDVIILKDVTEDQKGIDTMGRFSYHPLETEPNMVLSIDPAWQTYDDYLAALGARYRRNAKDQAKKLTQAGCTIERICDLTNYSARLHELYLSVQSHASVRLVTIPESYLPALAQAAGDDFRCNVIRQGERILGFVTCLRDGATAIGYYIGFDREAAAQGLPIYLQLLHCTIANAIEWRCSRLSLGRTALEPKAALGAKPEQVTVWLRHRVPILNWMIAGLLGAVPHSESPKRNPFREGAVS